MNKLFYFLSLLLLFPGMIFAKANYARSFANPPVSSSLVVDIAAQDYDIDINCGGLKFWGIQAIEHKTGNRFSGNPRFVSSAVLSQTFTINAPAGDYEEMTFICSDNGEDEAFQFGSLENDLAGDQIIFIASDVSSITSDLSDGKIVTAPIDGVVVSSTSTATATGTVTASSHTAAVFEAGGGILDALVNTFLNIIGVNGVVESTTSSSSVSGNTNTNGTTTTTF